MKKSYKYLLLTLALAAAYALDHIHRAAGLIPFLAMSWNPTTGATGAGNVAAGQYNATGTATTLLWGTSYLWAGAPPTGWLTITDFKQRTKTELTELMNGDGLTAGTVQLIDGFIADVEVRDDINQVTSALTSGQRIYIYDAGGLVPGGARGSQYRGIIGDHDWNTAPKTPAGRRLSIHVYLLIS